MNEILNIPTRNLILFHLILLVPAFFSFYYRLSLVRNILISFSRMSIQLYLLGLYLQYLFEKNSFFLNFIWLIIMVITTNYHILSSAGLKHRIWVHFFQFLWGLLWATLLSTGSLFLIVMGIDSIFNVRYFIPLAGMVLGNALRGNIIALERFIAEIKNNQSRFELDLCDGATPIEASEPFLRDSLRSALSPVLSTFATMGIISIPGMMTGQILAGVNPEIAVKYQIIIAITIFFMVFLSTFFYLKIAQKKLAVYF